MGSECLGLEAQDAQVPEELPVTPQTSNAVIEQALEAQVRNLEQDRLLANDTEDIDSISEHAAWLLRFTTGETREHVAEIVRLASRLRRSNGAERDCERSIPPLLEPTWSYKRAAAELRDPLATLTNPIIKGRRRDEAMARVVDVIVACPREVLRGISLAHELRTAKTTVLWALMDELEARDGR